MIQQNGWNVMLMLTGPDLRQDHLSNDPPSPHLHTSFALMYASCPIIWGSKLQMLISLSTTEAEYITLSLALHEVTVVINLLEEIHYHGIAIHPPMPQVMYQVFKDNQSCIEITTNLKI